MKLTLQEQIEEARRLVRGYIDESELEARIGDLTEATNLLIRSSFIVGRMTRAIAGETD